MAEIKIDPHVLQEIVEQNLPKIVQEALVDRYDSPLKKAVEAAVKEKDGAINKMVQETLATVFSDPKFKEKVADHVIINLVQKSLR